MTPTMLKILKDRQNINVVGFYIGGSWEGFFSDLTPGQRSALKKEFSENSFVISTQWGYDELYITRAGDDWKLKEKPLKPNQKKYELGTEAYEVALEKNFNDKRKAIMKQRIMLDRFVKMIA
jgi:hypothetical protein